MKFTTRRIRFIPLILFLALISTQSGLAKSGLANGALVKVAITIPRMDNQLVITDPTVLEAFTFFNHPERILSRSPDFKPSVELGEGYRIDRYLVENSVWDTLTYYPDPKGGNGYIYYNGSKYPAMTPDHGLWFRASPEGDAAMRQMIAAYLEPSATPASSPSLGPVFIGTLAVLMMFVLIVSIAAQARRTRKAAPSA
ncbi:MAG TPA: hypothetical protein VI451_03510 [Anaerolineales bacterium]|nr:hypothetical protein [Anaerolineales bacterium]